MAEKKKSEKGVGILVAAALLVAITVGALSWYFINGQTNTDFLKSSSAQSGTDNSNKTGGNSSGDEADKSATGAGAHYTVEKDKDGNDIYKYSDIPIDFENMQEINEDLYSWIYIPNTQIDNPVAQSKNNDEYYLSHDIYGNYSIYGTLFTEHYNSKDFNDPNTIIYGHDMLNGSMFQNLKLYEDKKYFNANPYFYIFTPNKVLTYEIFSVFFNDDNHLMYTYDFKNKEDFQRFINKAIDRNPKTANIRKDVEVDNGDKLVTLSTSDADNEGVRLLVVGKLIDEQKFDKK